MPVGSLVAYLTVDGATKAAVEIGDVQRSLDLAAGSATRMGAATDKGMAAATAGTSKLTVAQLRAVAASERYNTLLDEGGASTARLASAEASLISANMRVAASTDVVNAAMAETATVADSAFAGGMTRAAGAVTKLGGGFLGLVRTIVPVQSGFGLAAVAVAAGLAVSTRAAAEFDARMANIHALLGRGQLPSDMDDLRTAALHVGQVYGYTANQVADAEAELVKAGVSVHNIMGGALVGALTLAAAGQEDVAAATQTATIAITQFNLKGSDVPHVADLLAAGADKALGSVGDLSEALKYGGLAASQADQSIEGTVGTLAEFAQAGLLGSSAGSALSMMLQNLEHASGPAAKMMDQYGISLYNADGSTKSYTQIAGMLHDSLSKLPPAERQAALATIFTARARRAATILTNDGAAANARWTKTVNDQGFAAQQASGKLDSLSGDWQKLKAAAETDLIEIGQAGQGPLRDVVQGATDVLKVLMVLGHDTGEVIKFFEDNRVAADALAVVLTAALGPALLRTTGEFAAMAATGAASIFTRIGGSAAGAVGPISAAEGASGKLGAVWETSAGKAGIIGAAVVGLYEGGKALGGMFNGFTTPSVQEFAAEVINAAKDTDDSGRSMLGLINVLAQLGGMAGPAFADSATKIDTALTGLVTSGHADQAATSFDAISRSLHAAGMSTEDIMSLLPGYQAALSDSATSAKEAGTGVDQYGNDVSAAAKKTQTATTAIKDYSDALHALNDPLFAMSSALQDLKTKQDAADKATRKYGADSKQAHQANLQVAQSSMQVAGAADELAKRVDSGAISIHKAQKELHGWVQAGLLTQKQADSVAVSFGGLITKAGKIDDTLSGAASSFISNGGKMSAATAHTVAQILAKLDALEGDGKTAGENLALGLAAGIEARSGVPIAAAEALGARAAHGINTGAGNSSPSKKARQSGAWLMQGFGLGMHDWGKVAVDTATKYGSEAASALGHVLNVIGKATAPAITDPSQLAGILTGDTGRAVNKRTEAQKDKGPYDAAKRTLHDLTTVNVDTSKTLLDSARNANSVADAIKRLKDAKIDNTTVDAAKSYAKHLSNVAYNAHKAAEAMPSKTKAEQADKAAAEDAARADDKQAREASNAAAAIEKQYQRVENAASKAADKTKAAWQKSSDAAKKAAQTAATAAEALVSSLQSAADQMSSTITDFESTIQSGLTGDYSLSTLWGNLVDAQSSAASDLASALSTYQDAQDAVTSAGTDATADQLATLATARDALTKAQAEADQANAAVSPTGLQDSLDTIIANTEQFRDDLQSLIDDHASKAEISQVVGMGPVAGDQLAKALLAAGQGSIDALGNSLDAIASISGNAADEFASEFYGGGVTAMEQFILGLETKFPELKAALDPILKELAGLYPFLTTVPGSTAPNAPKTGKGSTSGFGGAHGWGVPAFAAGVSNFAGGLALVGEQGPEFVTLPKGANVHPHGTDGASLLDLTAVVDRLDRIESALLTQVPALNAEANSVALAPVVQTGVHTLNSRLLRDRRRGG